MQLTNLFPLVSPVVSTILTDAGRICQMGFARCISTPNYKTDGPFRWLLSRALRPWDSAAAAARSNGLGRVNGFRHLSWDSALSTGHKQTHYLSVFEKGHMWRGGKPWPEALLLTMRVTWPLLVRETYTLSPLWISVSISIIYPFPNIDNLPQQYNNKI